MTKKDLLKKWYPNFLIKNPVYVDGVKNYIIDNFLLFNKRQKLLAVAYYIIK